MKSIAGPMVFLLALAALSGVSIESAAGKHADSLTGMVVDEQGKAVAGADVVYSWWDRELKNQTVAAKSDEHGQFKLQPPATIKDSAWPKGEVWAGFPGRRLTHRPLFEDGRPPAELRLVLPDAANVAVVVTGPDGKGVAGAKIALPVITYPEGGGRIVPEVMHRCTESTTDREGKARLTAFGRDELLQIRVVSDKYGTQSRYLTPATDAQSEIAIALRPTGRVRGRLVAPEPGLIDGVGVWVLSYPSDNKPNANSTLAEATATSDKDGRFEIPAIAAGTIRHITVVHKPERPFLPDVPAEVNVAAGQTAELTIPFKPAVRVRGIVREANSGKPLSDVMIGVNENGGSSSARAVTDGDGRFELVRVPGPLNFYLQFSKPREAPGWFRYRYFQLPGGKADFDLPPIELAVARGRVVDGAGRPLAGAKIEKAETKYDFDGTLVENPAVWYTEPRQLSTDAGGEFRAWVEVGGAYRVQIGMPGRAPQWSEWVEIAADAPPVFPDVVIQSLWSVAGQVIDRQGRPVPKATVFQAGDGPERTEAISDDEGRFQLGGYQNKSAFIFAQKDGFRFHGQPLKIDEANVQIVLARSDEPPQRRLSTVASGDPAAELALAMRILQPALDGLAKQDDERERSTVLGELAEIDPAAALERLDAWGMKGERAEMTRFKIAKDLSAEHPDDAADLIEALDDAYSRAACYVMSADSLPSAQNERRLEWLGKARLHLRGAGDATMRTALTAYMARLMAESGDADGARKLVDAIKPEVEKQPYDGVGAYVRGVTAEALAVFDLPAALAMIKDVKDDREYDRHHGNIARMLAAEHPVDAVRVLKLLRDEFQRDLNATYAAHLMARADRARADEAIDLIGRPPYKTFAQGLCVQALEDKDMPEVMARVEEVYESLAQLNAADEGMTWNGYHTAPVFAAWFLPVVEKLAPDRVEEYMWRAVSLRPPLSHQGDREQVNLGSRAYLAMFLARYDRELARALDTNLADEAFKKLNADEFSSAASGIFAAAAMIDPEWAVEQYEKLPGDLPYIGRVRRALVGILSKQGEARWRAASDQLGMPMPWHQIQ